MTLLNIKNQILSFEYDGLLVSTTSKKSNNISRLPDRVFNKSKYLNILITDMQIAKEILEIADGKVKSILIDVERKQKINLMKIAIKKVKKSHIIPYKPNDVTLEAADQLVSKYTNQNLIDKDLIIFGTGNLAFKLALRMLERGANIHLVGRNVGKVNNLVDTLNYIKPQYSDASAFAFNSHEKHSYDGMISFVSAEKVVTEAYADYITPEGFAIDGGIGNFSGEFIALCLEKSINVTRLDVRLGNEFLSASIKSLSKENSFFEEVMGVEKYEELEIVAGGIIGQAGSIIVDKIKEPKQIIGVANGYGGLKNKDDYTKEDEKNLQYAKEIII